MSVIAESIELIESQASVNDGCVVALDGKDSMVVLDLCRPRFKRIEAFTMVYAFGTDRFKRKAEYVKARWGVDLKEVEHFGAIDHRNRGEWCLPSRVDGPRRMRDAYEQQRQEYGLSLIATGSRMSESLGRKQCIERGTWPGWHPIAHWRKRDVLAYLERNSIPLPDESRDMQGVSLDRKTILGLKDNCPRDYELIRKRFPMIEAAVKQREWYGRTA